MQTVGQQLGNNQLPNFDQTPALVSTDGVGVELELEGFTDDSIRTAYQMLGDLWSVGRDGSLRNGGVEFVTNGGLGGTVLERAINSMHQLLAEVPYENTFRCSTHMHINMNDFTIPQVVRFVLAYACCEPFLFAFAGDYRYASNFCTPIAESLPFHKRAISMLTENAVKRGMAAKYCNKYTALNLLTLFPDSRAGRALGTVEFRGSRALDTREEFLQLANLLLSIKQYVRTFNGTDDEFLSSLQGGVVGPIYSSELVSNLTVSQDMAERALVNGWLLLKSYQNGVAKGESTLPVVDPDIQAALLTSYGRPRVPSAAQIAAQERVNEIMNLWPATTRNWPSLQTEGYTLCSTRTPHVIQSMQKLLVGLWGTSVGRKAIIKSSQQWVFGEFTPDEQGSAVHLVLAIRQNAENTRDINPHPTVLGPAERHEWCDARYICYNNLIPRAIYGEWKRHLYMGDVEPDSPSNLDLMNYMATKSVRLKYRNELNEALRAAGCLYAVQKNEPIIRVRALMRIAHTDYNRYVWSADIENYVAFTHAMQVVADYGMLAPTRYINVSGALMNTVNFVNPMGMTGKIGQTRDRDSNMRWMDADDQFVDRAHVVENPIFDNEDNEVWTQIY